MPSPITISMEVRVVDTLDKIRKLVDKQNGIGIPKTLIGRYCGRDRATLDYYLKGADPAPEVIETYEAGLQQLLEDMRKIIED